MVKRKVPKVSIVVPSYNRKKDLLECLESIRKNKYPNIEVIVALNGCTDGSEQAVKKAFPFPPFPKSLGKQKKNFKVNLLYE